MSYAVHKMLSSPKFIKRYQQKVNIIRKFDIPYLAGYSKNGRNIYIDRHMNTDFHGVDITPFLITHEKIEKTLIDIYHLDYQKAHHIAQHVERDTVRDAGLDWSSYQKWNSRYIKELDHENLRLAPRDLDLTPYKDEKEFKIFSDKLDKYN